LRRLTIFRRSSSFCRRDRSYSSALYYLGGGGAALAAIPLLSHFGQSATFVLPNPAVWQVFATAGFAGGFIYWLLAGRRA